MNGVIDDLALVTTAIGITERLRRHDWNLASAGPAGNN
jgi:hypothetical protein